MLIRAWQIACAGLVIGLPATIAAQTLPLTISGMVVTGPQSTPVAGATVRLGGLPPDLTDADGRFQLTGLEAARYTISVQAIGYQPRLLQVTLRADTTLRVVLQPTSVVLDPVVVRARGGAVTIKGTIRNATTGRKVLAAQVVLRPGSGVVGAESGNFRLKGVPRGEQVSLFFEAFEHLPAQFSFVAENDTTLDVVLAPDSVGMRMVAAQVKRLTQRANSFPFAVRTLNRDRISRWNFPLDELIKQNMPLDPTRQSPSTFRMGQSVAQRLDSMCVVLDDREAPFYVLKTLSPEIIARVEIFGQRAKMIRIYTTGYVAKLMGQPMLPAIAYFDNGWTKICG